MKQMRIGIELSRRYVAALQKHLRQGPRAIAPRGTAHAWGRQAAALGLETLDVARIHEDALATLESAGISGGVMERAALFFAEAIAPIKEAHHTGLQANVPLIRSTGTPGRSALSLAAAKQALKQSITQRRAAEEALRKSGEQCARLLADSRHRHEKLRCLTHQILSAQEEERKAISRDLQNEIAQTLLGINVHLLTLQQEAAVNEEGLKKEIASTQRLMKESIQSINRFARDLDIHRQA